MAVELLYSLAAISHHHTDESRGRVCSALVAAFNTEYESFNPRLSSNYHYCTMSCTCTQEVVA